MPPQEGRYPRLAWKYLGTGMHFQPYTTCWTPRVHTSHRITGICRPKSNPGPVVAYSSRGVTQGMLDGQCYFVMLCMPRLLVVGYTARTLPAAHFPRRCGIFHASSMEDTTSAISGSCLTIVAAPSLLIARVCPLGDTVFALACLAGEERMRHLAALLVRWSLA